jgi:hypothetical protein
MPKRSRRRKGLLNRLSRSVESQNSDDFLLQPWFLPNRISLAIRRLLPSDYRHRMRDFFDDYGCMVCRRRDLLHKSNGMCMSCAMNIQKKIWRSAIRRKKGRARGRLSLGLLAYAQQAQKLLAGFPRTNETVPKKRRMATAHSHNPVREAFAPTNEWLRSSRSRSHVDSADR